MKGKRLTYTAQDIGVVIPTKDRPGKLRNLLESLSQQSRPCAQIIIVDGGQSSRNIMIDFSARLPVEYFECIPSGQIRQRNMGIKKLKPSIRLVAFVDDDLVLEVDALEKMVDFWNEVEENTGGIGFNIVNVPPERHSTLWGLFLMSSPVRGCVLRSGYSSGIHNVPSGIRTQWLGGGYTVWKREILRRFQQQDLNTPWATGEDLRFSYPIGKLYPLYVCAAAKVRHEHIYDQYPDDDIDRTMGRKTSVASFYFVGLYPELSRAACLWMLIGSTVVQSVYACLTLNPKLIKFIIGKGEAILICLKSMFGFSCLLSELEN